MSKSLTRRHALQALGIGAVSATLPGRMLAQPAFPKGAIIRTILKDYPPEELAGGATGTSSESRITGKSGPAIKPVNPGSASSESENRISTNSGPGTRIER